MVTRRPTWKSWTTVKTFSFTYPGRTSPGINLWFNDMRAYLGCLRLHVLFTLIALLGMPPRAVSQGVITTIAGTDLTYPGSSFSALSASFGELSGVAVSPSSEVYFASVSRSLVLKFNPQHNSVVVVAGIGIEGYSGDGGPATQAELSAPQQLAFDQAGNLYIADRNNGRIRKVDTQGTITTFAVEPDGNVAGVAVAPNGAVYGSDYAAVFSFGTNGVATLIAGNPSQQGYAGDGGPAIKALFNQPFPLAFDNAGNLLIADSGNFRVRRITADGNISTIAGNGQMGTWNGAANGQPALATALNPPISGLAVDSSGNLYIATSQLLEVGATGTISVLNANTSTFILTQPGPLSNAAIDPVQLAFDQTGNLYFTDYWAYCLYRSTGGIVQAMAAYAPEFGIGDNGPAVLAGLSGPAGLALSGNGSLLVADQYNQRIRQISPAGTITTVIGTGSPNLPPSGTATALTLPLVNPSYVATDAAGHVYVSANARLFEIAPSGAASQLNLGTVEDPSGVAVDAQGNLLVADLLGNKVVRFAPNGTATTIAGNGQAGFSGDGGPATSASLNMPLDVAVGADGSIYIADSDNNRIRKVSPAGIISSIGPTPNLCGASVCWDGFTHLAVDKPGNVYIATYNNRVEEISTSGQLAVLAGNGIQGFSGDGGPASGALVSQPAGIAVDGAGNVYFSDSGNNRIREILAAPPSFAVSSSQLNLSATALGQPVSGQITVTASIQDLQYSIGFVTASGGDWLGVTSLQGAAPGVVTIILDPSSLQAGTYHGTVNLTCPLASPSNLTIAVTFEVGSSQPAKLSLETTSLAFAFTSGSGQASQQLSVSNTGASVSFTASAATASGGSWLQVSPTSGTSSAASAGILTVTAIPGALAVGTYSGSITVASAATGDLLVVPVTMAINAAQQNILLSQTGLTFTAVAQGGSVLPQTIGILNAGSGSMSWTAQASTLSGGNWLSLSSTSGTVAEPLLDVSYVSVQVNPQSLTPGNYYGSVQVSAGGAANSPESVTVVLNVLAPGSNPGPQVSPTGLVFTGMQGGGNPGSQSVTVSNLTGAQQLSYGSSAAYANGSNWLSYLPANATLDPVTPSTLVIQPDFGSLAAGIYRGAITLALTDGSIRTVSILSVVASGTGAAIADSAGRAGAFPMASGNCTPSLLQIQLLSSEQVLTASLGQPLPMQVQIVDDCGTPVTPQRGGVTVAAAFGNGDAELPLVHTENGNWSGTWLPRNGTAGISVAVRVAALLALASGKVLVGSQIVLTVTLAGGAGSPVPTAVLNGASFVNTGTLAPGALISVFGSGLGTTSASGSTPLPTDLAGTEVTLAGQALPLLYASAGQVNAQVPYTLAVNTALQLQVKQGNTLSVPEPLTVAPAQPAVFTVDQSGSGQGEIYNLQYALVDANAPAAAGDTVLIYCTGLGAVNPAVPGGVPAPSSPYSETLNPLTVTIGGQPAAVSFAGLAPGFVGLYQVNATVPTGVPSGNAVQVVLQIAGQTSPVVTMAVE